MDAAQLRRDLRHPGRQAGGADALRIAGQHSCGDQRDQHRRDAKVQTNTPSRSVLVAMMVCPATTPTNDTIRTTSMTRSPAADLFASTAAGPWHNAATAMPQREA